MIRPALTRIAALALLLAATNAAAADWSTQAGSTLGFTATYDGEAFDGTFKTFTPQIRFDPAKPAGGLFDVRIKLASADTKNEERDDTLRGADFFNTGKFAEARFTASKFRALGGNKFAADGTLSLNGISKPVVLQFTFTPGERAVLAGSATVKRLDFKVGTGDWSDTGDLPDDVKVSTKLLLSPVTPPGTPAPKQR